MKTKEKKWWWLVIPAIAAYIIKNIFVGADIDESYAVMVGYRLAMGDHLLLEMWEPHQTSAIFTAMFIKPFLWLSGGSAEFLNIYLEIVYFLVQGAITLFLYKTFAKCVSGIQKADVQWLALVFFVFSPKSVYVPDYTNLHIWFVMLLVLCLIWYYCETSPVRGKLWVLALAGLCLTGDVLSYPSMVLLLPVCLFFIWRKHIHQVFREWMALVLPCVISALLFFGYILSYMTLEQMLHVIPYVLGDGSHKLTLADKAMTWATDFGIMGVVAAVTLGLGVAVAAIYGKLKNGHQEKLEVYSTFFFFGFQLIYQFYLWIFGGYNAAQSLSLYSSLVLIGIYTYYRGGKREKTGIYLVVFSLVSYVGIILMSNWRPLILLSYLIVGALGGLLCWNSYLQNQDIRLKDIVLQILCCVLVMSNVLGYCWLVIGGEESHSTLLSVRGIHKSGFRAGIFTSYMSAYRYNTNAEQWPEAVPDGSTVLYVGPSQFFYMLGDCTIASPNTISTPTYDESLLEYWEMNPERYPDVIVVESWFGDIRVEDEHGFIMNWIENEYGAAVVEDYSYVRVYRK